jgi:hypothetical protein
VIEHDDRRSVQAIFCPIGADDVVHVQLASHTVIVAGTAFLRPAADRAVAEDFGRCCLEDAALRTKLQDDFANLL